MKASLSDQELVALLKRPEITHIATHYIRAWNTDQTKKPDRIGALVAFTMPATPGRIYIGFSLCNNRDTFNRHKGLFIATERAKFHFDTPEWFGVPHGNNGHRRKDPLWGRRRFVFIPETVYPHLMEFINRIRLRYPDAVFPKWTQTISVTETVPVAQEA